MSDPYPKLHSATDVPAAEEAIIAYWDRANTFARSVDERPADKQFVFYEGPPTANGKPGVHHVIARLTKDLACRYKTMTGHRVVRKAGWDTHGLPVEIEVENQLGIKKKEEIEAFGIAEFNAKCKESVFTYEQDWKEFTKRIAYWVDMDNPYVTCENEYIESVWWILKQFWEKDLIYQGHKIVPFCPRCETSLSSHEVSQGYRDVSDPSIFVTFKRADADEYFLVWTHWKPSPSISTPSASIPVTTRLQRSSLYSAWNSKVWCGRWQANSFFGFEGCCMGQKSLFIGDLDKGLDL